MTLDFLGVDTLSFRLLVYYNIILLSWRNRPAVVKFFRLGRSCNEEVSDRIWQRVEFRLAVILVDEFGI